MSFFTTLWAIILNNKVVVVLGLLTFIFFICTVALAVEKDNLKAKIANLTTNIKPKSAEQNREARTISIQIRNLTMSSSSKWSEWRLPKGSYKTREYILKLQPNLQDGTYNGEITILFEILQPLEILQLNSKGLTIQESDVIVNDAVGHPHLHYDDVKEMITLTSKNGPFPIGNNTLKIKFSGDMKDRIVGMYRSSYINEKGENR